MPTTNKDMLLALRIRSCATHRADREALRKLMPILLEAIGWDGADEACTFNSYDATGSGMIRSDLEIKVGPGINSVKTTVLLQMGDSFLCGAEKVELKKGGFSFLDMPGAVYRDIMSKL